MKRLELTGYKVGMLTVLGYSHSHTQPSKQKRAMWNVICECGTTKKVSTANLRGKTAAGKINTVSCGCYLKKIRFKARKDPDEVALTYLYLHFKHSAKNREYNFLLNREEVKYLTKQNCYYCNTPPKFIFKIRRFKTYNYLYNGIDRVDNSIGYELNNCVTCCGICNIMKMALEKEKFLTHISKIYMHMKGNTL